MTLVKLRAKKSFSSAVWGNVTQGETFSVDSGYVDKLVSWGMADRLDAPKGASVKPPSVTSDATMTRAKAPPAPVAATPEPAPVAATPEPAPEVVDAETAAALAALNVTATPATPEPTPETPEPTPDAPASASRGGRGGKGGK